MESNALQQVRMPSNFKRQFPFLGVPALVCLLALAGQPANAQVVYGSVVGSVVDTSGAGVPGANVRITNVATNDTRTAQTYETGGYTISTVTPGTYNVEVAKQGFRTFLARDILVNMNNVVRVNAQLEVGAVSESIEVSATTAVLQTDRADIHAEVTTQNLIDLPQPNRAYQGMMQLVPGTTPPGGQLSGGTNNPSKGETFSFNGTGTAAAAVRIEGINAINPWAPSNQSYVPSIEAVQNVNVATSATDAEQAMSGGVSVNVMLKSGSNETHGVVFWYNSVSATGASNFFANKAGYPKPHLVNNNAGGNMGGHILRNKLFYFGSYEGDVAHTADSGLLSIPNRVQLSGDMSGSSNPIYDPLTGTVDGRNRTPFARNFIPSNRVDPVVKKIIPDIPPTNFGGDSVTQNYYMNRATIYNLHKIDTKFDYNATSKLRLSGRWGKQPYYNFQQPIYGEVLGGSSGFPQSAAGNYLQHGHGVTVSGSATYVAGPTLVIDGTWGHVKSHQLLFPNLTNVRYGSEVLGIPGANQGPLPWSGGVPNFAISNFVTMGMSYPAVELLQPVYEYTSNVSKIKGSHTIRAGVDAIRIKDQHIEVRNNTWSFTGASTILNGGPGANAYNALSDFLLGRFYSATNWKQVVQPYLTMITWQYALYVRDQWQASRKLTLNYGVRWEKYPVPSRGQTGIHYWNIDDNTMQVCGVGGTPWNCGIQTSNRIFGPNLGIAYRPFTKFVIRAGYSLSPDQTNMATGEGQMQNFPAEFQLNLNPLNPYDSAGSLSTGMPIIPDPVGTNGLYVIPASTGNILRVISEKKYVRGYIQSYNFTIQQELPWGLLGQVGYVGTHAVKMQRALDINYARVLGGGNASMLLYKFNNTSSASTMFHDGASKYNSLQSVLTKRLGQGLTFHTAYTYSKLISLSSSMRLPEYWYRNMYTAGADRTHHLIVSASYDLPFGKGRMFAQQPAVSAILGGWNVNGIFNHWSGSPFTVSSSSSSVNTPGSSQTADLINPNVAKIGGGQNGDANSGNINDAYFDVMAYAPVTGVRFGTGGFNQLRGPGNDNLDVGAIRTFKITERYRFQLRAEALNVSNTPHFANPGTNVSNMQTRTDPTTGARSLVKLGGFGQISGTVPMGRIIDQRYFRFAARFMW